jgi:hypothetical protein
MEKPTPDNRSSTLVLAAEVAIGMFAGTLLPVRFYHPKVLD